MFAINFDVLFIKLLITCSNCEMWFRFRFNNALAKRHSALQAFVLSPKNVKHL